MSPTGLLKFKTLLEANHRVNEHDRYGSPIINPYSYLKYTFSKKIMLFRQVFLKRPDRLRPYLYSLDPL